MLTRRAAALIAALLPFIAQEAAAVEIEDPDNTLLMTLKSGVVTIRLLPDVAPKHVERLKTLAREGAYDGVAFHRVIPGFMAQTGDVEHGNTAKGYNARRAGTGGSSHPDLPAEFSKVPFERGTVGMARSQNPNSANSQFFIMFEEGSFLNGQYTVFGQVIDGMAHVDNIKMGSKANNGAIDGEPDAIVSLKVAADK
jgi:cyclophilin family peptidyl-prolyl cis-trans isomerase